jgi:hypothetical protein
MPICLENDRWRQSPCVVAADDIRMRPITMPALARTEPPAKDLRPTVSKTAWMTARLACAEPGWGCWSTLTREFCANCQAILRERNAAKLL